VRTKSSCIVPVSYASKIDGNDSQSLSLETAVGSWCCGWSVLQASWMNQSGKRHLRMIMKVVWASTRYQAGTCTGMYVGYVREMNRRARKQKTKSNK
jgi:hypothetical protein